MGWRTNLNTEVNQVNQNVDRRTDRWTSSIHKPELLCNPAKNRKTAKQSNTPSPGQTFHARGMKAEVNGKKYDNGMLVNTYLKQFWRDH